MNEYMNCKAPATEEIPIVPVGPRSAAGNIIELRKIQYETIHKLCILQDDLIGEACVKEHQEILAKFQEEVQGIVNLTAFVCAQSRAIADLVEECRQLIGV